MKIFLMLLLALKILEPVPEIHDPVELRASDGVRVFAERHRPMGAPDRAIALLFHQAGSSSAEYTTDHMPIASRLAAWKGITALAIDQRSGDGMYGPNQTAEAYGKKAEYLDALPDLEAALAWAKKTYPRKPIVLWGSSYSASLVFLVAAKHPNDVAAVIAFSPGEYFDDKTLVQRAAAKVRVPIFVDSAADAEEIAAARTILAASPAGRKVQYVPKVGIHGSSTLRNDRDPKGYEQNWNAVAAFLDSVIPK